jgi:hypothetical protein
MEPEGSFPHSHVSATCPYPEPLRSYQIISPGPRHVFMFRSKGIFTVRCCQHLSQPQSWRTTPCRPFGDYSFDIFAATLHIRGRSSIRNLRTRHVVVTETHLSRDNKLLYTDICIRNLSRLYTGTLFYLSTYITNSLIPFRVTTVSAVQIPSSLP